MSYVQKTRLVDTLIYKWDCVYFFNTNFLTLVLLAFLEKSHRINKVLF